jgi:hypothetical protein
VITVHLKLALICFLQQCHPALVGGNTPKGEFTIQQRMVLAQGYGGDVLQFHEDDKYVYAIHRVWTLRPRERRRERLQSPNAEDRKFITNGCVNVSPEVYDKLVKLKGSKVRIVD